MPKHGKRKRDEEESDGEIEEEDFDELLQSDDDEDNAEEQEESPEDGEQETEQPGEEEEVRSWLPVARFGSELSQKQDELEAKYEQLAYLKQKGMQLSKKKVPKLTRSSFCSL